MALCYLFSQFIQMVCSQRVPTGVGARVPGKSCGRKVGGDFCDSLGMRAERKGRPHHFLATKLEVRLSIGARGIGSQDQ